MDEGVSEGHQSRVDNTEDTGEETERVLPGDPGEDAGTVSNNGDRRTWAGTHGGEMLAEFFGTFILVLLGCASVAVAIVGLPGSGRQETPFGPADWLIIAWGWGFGVVFGVYACAGVSGGHINPAVTFAFALRRGFPWRKVPGYWLAQVVGGFAGAALVYATYVSAIDWYNHAHHIADRSQGLDTFAIFATYPAKYFQGSWAGPFLDQVVGTGVLVALIAALLDRRNNAPESRMGPFLIGLVVVAIGMSFGTNAGYAINPARDLGPRLWTYFTGWGKLAFPGQYEYFAHYWWIPIVGPLVGAAIGILAYDVFTGSALRGKP